MPEKSLQVPRKIVKSFKPKVRKVSIESLFKKIPFPPSKAEHDNKDIQLTTPIRKIVEPLFVEELRDLQFKRYKYLMEPDRVKNYGQQLDELNRAVFAMHFRPEIHLTTAKARANVPSHPFRDIFYCPPKEGSEQQPLDLASQYRVHRFQNASSESGLSPLPSRIRWDQKSAVPAGTSQTHVGRSERLVHGIPRQQQQRSSFSTSIPRSRDTAPSPPLSPEPLDIDRYHRLADTYIDNLVAKLEEIQEERDEVDCEYSAGVLTLTFPPAGTYVLNKQPPNKQIWLSSPISGPKRYDYVGGASSSSMEEEMGDGGNGAARGGAGIVEERKEEKNGGWVYLRDGSSLSGLLREELGVELDVDAVD